MRKDYVEPDDYEYEPTPHDDVLEKAQAALPGMITARMLRHATKGGLLP